MDSYPKLTRRELQTLRCIIEEGINDTKTLMRFLGISNQTVAIYRKRIVAKLDARSMAHAVYLAMTSEWYHDQALMAQKLGNPLPPHAVRSTHRVAVRKGSKRERQRVDAQEQARKQRRADYKWLWNEQHRDELLAYQKVRYRKNRERLKAAARRRYREDPEKHLEGCRRWQSENRERIRRTFRRWRAEHKEERTEYCRVWRKEHPEACRESRRKWEQAHIEERRAYKREYARRKSGYYERHPELANHSRRDRNFAGGGALSLSVLDIEYHGNPITYGPGCV